MRSKRIRKSTRKLFLQTVDTTKDNQNPVTDHINLGIGTRVQDEVYTRKQSVALSAAKKAASPQSIREKSARSPKRGSRIGLTAIRTDTLTSILNNTLQTAKV